jgi:hypothetical protein
MMMYNVYVGKAPYIFTLMMEVKGYPYAPATCVCEESPLYLMDLQLSGL